MAHHPQPADKTMISQTSGASGGRGRGRGRGGRDALLDDAKRESEALAAALTEARQQASKLQTELERERIANRQAFQIVETFQCLSLEKRTTNAWKEIKK